MNRYPPEKVRKQLREEVNFGCPVVSCGSPYLYYHHFDPPWSEKKHHDANGMIALCPHHHNLADKGAYTNKQLNYLKKYPYLEKKNKYPKGRFDWKREQLLLLVGGNFFINTSIILNAEGSDILWLSKDEEGYELLNFDVHDSKGDILLRMRNNDWEIFASLDDLVCPPSGNSLKFGIKSKKTWLNLKFSQCYKPELLNVIKRFLMQEERDRKKLSKKYFPNIADKRRNLDCLDIDGKAIRFSEKIKKDIKEDIITICKFHGHLIWPCDILMKETYLMRSGPLGPLIYFANFYYNLGKAVKVYCKM